MNNNHAKDDAGQSTRCQPCHPRSRVVMYDSSSRDSDSIALNADKDDSATENGSEVTDLRTEIERTIDTLRTHHHSTTSHYDPSGTPIRCQETNTGTAEDETIEGLTGRIWSKRTNKEMRNKVRFESEPRRSVRIRTSKRVETLGGVESFQKISCLGKTPIPTPRRYPVPPFPHLKKDMPNHEWFPLNPRRGKCGMKQPIHG